MRGTLSMSNLGTYGLVLAVLVGCLPLAGCTVGHSITAIDVVAPAAEHHAYYALPRTVVVVRFPVEKKVLEKGSGKPSATETCYDKLKDPATFLDGTKLQQAIGLRDVPAVGNASFAVTGPPTIELLAEADPSQIFRVDLSSSWGRKRLVD